MDAIRDYTGGENAAVLAVQAGNDMLTSSDFVTQYNAVLAAVQDGTIPESQIHASASASSTGKCSLTDFL